MIRCYNTGVQCEIDEAYVLNRRDAADLLHRLRDRAASLERIVAQFAPLDDFEPRDSFLQMRPAAPSPKKHRLVCKAIADAMGPAFPEIQLFIDWPQYQERARNVIRRGHEDHANQSIS